MKAICQPPMAASVAHPLVLPNFFPRPNGSCQMPFQDTRCGGTWLELVYASLSLCSGVMFGLPRTWMVSGTEVAVPPFIRSSYWN